MKASSTSSPTGPGHAETQSWYLPRLAELRTKRKLACQAGGEGHHGKDGKKSQRQRRAAAPAWPHDAEGNAEHRGEERERRECFDGIPVLPL